MRKIVILTLFKEMFDAFLKSNAIQKAIDLKLIQVDIVDIRDFSTDKHKRVDFKPYGGGRGMIISCKPLSKAIEYVKEKNQGINFKVLYMSPRGKCLCYNTSYEMSKVQDNYIIICGHYEGIDERIIEMYNVEEISIGDYVLTGGELAAQVLIDSITRLMPGVLSDGSLDFESHTNNLLEYPQYTKPEIFNNMSVPEVLLSGNHQKINEYRNNESIRITKKYRPEFLDSSNKK